MGKAGKWIRNFLIGKREDGGKKTGPLSVSSETSPLITVTSVDNPKVRRRWSFKRSTSNKAVTIHRSSMSFDSIVMPTQAYHAQQKKRGMRRVLSANDAAMKIQAIYRSYLARRALRALRGLVKLQALARGYVVRRQMNTVVRSVHAVMKIQVRARINRVQMAEEPPVMAGRRSYRESPVSDRHLLMQEHTAEANGFRPSGGLRSRSHRAKSVLADREECGCKICCSDRLSVSQKDYKSHVLASPSGLSFTDSTSTTYDGQLEEYSLKMAQRNSRRYYSCPENKYPFICLPAQCPDYIPCGSHFTPNYMTNTESSKAKARSHSEPRQRPKSNKKQSRRTTSMDEKNDHENQYPWLTKLRRAGKFTTDRVSESYTSVATSISNSRRSLIPFEPPMNLN